MPLSYTAGDAPLLGLGESLECTASMYEGSGAVALNSSASPSTSTSVPIRAYEVMFCAPSQLSSSLITAGEGTTRASTSAADIQPDR